MRAPGEDADDRYALLADAFAAAFEMLVWGHRLAAAAFGLPLGRLDAGAPADLVVLAPATANLLGKAAHGIADDLLTLKYAVLGGVGIVDPKSDNLTLGDGSELQVDNGTSATIEGTYMFADHLGVELLAELQDMLYAQDRWAVLLVFQAMDAAGKDGAIKHVMSGVNPQGCQVSSFKAPSSEDLDHDFLWRCQKHLPERGRIGIFNRSTSIDVFFNTKPTFSNYCSSVFIRTLCCI